MTALAILTFGALCFLAGAFLSAWTIRHSLRQPTKGMVAGRGEVPARPPAPAHKGDR